MQIIEKICSFRAKIALPFANGIIFDQKIASALTKASDIAALFEIPAFSLVGSFSIA